MDYDEIFAPIARYTTIRSIIALAASQGWNLHQMDVKTIFLHGSLKEKVYVEQPEGFEVHNHQTHVCRLGLKQATRAWYERIDSYLMKLGFTRSEVDPSLYFKAENDRPLILIYTFLLREASSNEFVLELFSTSISSMFDLEELFRGDNGFVFGSRDHIPDIILHNRLILFVHCILPNLVFGSFFECVRLRLNNDAYSS